MLLDLISPRTFTHRYKLHTSSLCEHLPSACYFPVIKSKYPPQITQLVFFTNGQQRRFALVQRISVTLRVVHGMEPGNTVWISGIRGRHLTYRPEPAKISNNKKSVGLACAKVATVNPKVMAICVTLEESPKGVTLLQPTITRKNVPKNSADSMRHMLRLSVMSWSPITAFAPAYQHKHFH